MSSRLLPLAECMLSSLLENRTQIFFQDCTVHIKSGILLFADKQAGGDISSDSLYLLYLGLIALWCCCAVPAGETPRETISPLSRTARYKLPCEVEGFQFLLTTAQPQFVCKASQLGRSLGLEMSNQNRVWDILIGAVSGGDWRWAFQPSLIWHGLLSHWIRLSSDWLSI